MLVAFSISCNATSSCFRNDDYDDPTNIYSPAVVLFFFSFLFSLFLFSWERFFFSSFFLSFVRVALM
ncbi:hypothetical protein P170DRAFT_184390 [Aspergillus steynii IBT 23096]|uniref:Uncharacterized protein n=1 Tax=Aspergillus steynii IBT 23096 TaxID=1392250 RepID=A0A2I2G983_9EURO|nr:uncharacterized protein P170DRAFT_184390 [Aspergillus steynii IBT 23096]PLB49447.1 hypothetical protein P170DRAFT_184390 [Aspergillus steynii IBT 23096]